MPYIVIFFYYYITLKLMQCCTSDLCKNQIEELWDVFQKLDEINKATLLLMGRRLNEAQMENMLKKQIGDISDKNSDM